MVALGLVEPMQAQAPQSALERVRASGRLRVGIDATYPPFGIAEGGEFSGFDVDIARAIARELGVEAELINAGFDGVFPALQNGSFDVVISAVTITPERTATMLFSDPYIAAGQQIVVRADSTIAGPGNLAGRTVGVQINTTAQFSMEQRPGVTIAKYNTIDLALLDLQNGRVDAVASDGPVLRYMVRRSFQGLKPAGRRVHGRALRRGACTNQRRPAARGQRGTVASSGRRRIREDLHHMVRAECRRRPCLSDIARIRYGSHRADVVGLRPRCVDDGDDGCHEPRAGSALRLVPGAGPSPVEATHLDPGRHVRGSHARHAASRADPVRLLRSAERRHQSTRVRERHSCADPERVRVHLRGDPRRHRVDRRRPDGSRAGARA